MLRGKVEGVMALLSEGSSVKASPEDKQASAHCIRGSTLMWGAIFSVKSGPVPGFSGGSEYSVTLALFVPGYISCSMPPAQQLTIDGMSPSPVDLCQWDECGSKIQVCAKRSNHTKLKWDPPSKKNPKKKIRTKDSRQHLV